MLTAAYDMSPAKISEYCGRLYSNENAVASCVTHRFGETAPLLRGWAVGVFTLGSILLYYAAMVGDEYLAMRAALERARISRVSLRLFGCASEVARHIEGNQSSSVLSIAQQEMNSGSVTA